MKKLIAVISLFLVTISITHAEKPNIVYIICDDLGYGDIQCLAPATSKIPTPNTDKLAAGGMTFTDAHSGSSVCTPTRYGIMTGRYSWRTRLQKGVVTGFAPCLIAEDRPTVGNFLQDQGYHTAIVGKWHLDFQYLDPETKEAFSGKKHKSPPVGAVIPDGPLHRGFDFYHGFHHARNMEAVIEDDKVIAHDPVINMLPRLTRKSVDYINSRAGKEEPFFLYVPLGSPHTPIVPSPEWQGKSGLGDYGDFVMQTDNVVGEISAALEKNGFTENTLVIFTSDNGCSKAAGIPDLAKKGHKVSAHLRGSKADLWDGGHRIPFIARWPGKVESGSSSDQLICLTDLFATVGDITGSPVPEKSCEDSVSFLPALKGDTIESTRKGVIHHSYSGHFAYRQDNWKLLLAKASGGWTSPKENEAAANAPKAQLYDMSADIGEKQNLYTAKPEIAEKLLAQLEADIANGRSTAGPDSENDTDDIVLWKSEGKKKPVPTTHSGKRPNILFIIADDQSPFDFTFYNPDSGLNAPNIENLAAEGMVFDQAYHMGSYSGAVCRPSRHMIMTGRTLWNLRDKPKAKKRKKGEPKPAQQPLPPEVQEQVDNCMAAVFNRAGYDTMRTCKRGNSFELANQQFTVVKDATKRGPDEETGSAWHAEQVLDYLGERETSKDKDPFLIYYGFSHPHDPRPGPPELMEKYGAVFFTDKNREINLTPKAPALPINYLPAHPFHHGHPNLRDEVAVAGVWERRDETTIRNQIGCQYACSENVDIQIGRVLEKLKAMGELENTYILYTADHGMAIGRHGLQGKQNLYEHTWRVPFIVKGPGIKPGSRTKGNIYLLDVLGTMCDLAGIKKPESVESISFRPVLEGKKQTIRSVMYGAYCGGTKPGIRSVRQGDWKLIKYDVLDGEVRETQLFNLKENPHEFLDREGMQRDLAEDPEYAGVRKKMEGLLLKKMQRHGDPYPLWDQQ
ncbi:MAG: sulfatase-like hydrolase/transferase [Verrucomicrobiales bacterium]|nr:sulfatase-like hydrolase/transferase [Verrucomicrobiales bacterium]